MSDGKASGARLQRVIVRGARAGVREMGAIPMKLSDPVYVGLVRSHNAKALETAIFSDVTVELMKRITNPGH